MIASRVVKRPILCTGLAAAIVVFAAASFALGACSREECSAATDCTEVVCPDGSKITQCNEGVCATLNDCDQGSGW